MEFSRERNEGIREKVKMRRRKWLVCEWQVI